MAAQADGKLLVGAEPYSYGINTFVKGVVRLNVDGSVDASYNLGAGLAAERLPIINDLVIQRDGKAVVVGEFISADGQPRPGVARLRGDDGPPHPLFFYGEDAVPNAYSPELKGYYFLQRYPAFISSSIGTFGFYNYQFYPYLYHYDLGYIYVIDSTDAQHGIYFYDFKLQTFLYTTLDLFPYLYNFNASAFYYYFPDPLHPAHYLSNPRIFVNLQTNEFIFSP